ncbi:hypothetical protein ACJZ2D_017184 [Fusarium nematophilum]
MLLHTRNTLPLNNTNWANRPQFYPQLLEATQATPTNPPSTCLLSDLRNSLPAPARLPAALFLLFPSEAKGLDKHLRRSNNQPTYLSLGSTSIGNVSPQPPPPLGNNHNNTTPALTGSSRVQQPPPVLGYTDNRTRFTLRSSTMALFSMARVRICTCESRNSNTTPTLCHMHLINHNHFGFL